MRYGVSVNLRLKCVRIRVNGDPNSNRLKLLICDFADDNGNKVSNIHISVPDDKPMPFREGDLCIIVFSDFRQNDVVYVGKPLDDEHIDDEPLDSDALNAAVPEDLDDFLVPEDLPFDLYSEE